VGKTRTAIEACRRVAGDFPDGCWFVELESVPSGDAVADPIVSVLGELVPSAGSWEDVVTGLGDRRALVVLDNCEHVVASVGETVARIVTSCPTVSVLCTSRRRLDVVGERIIGLDPLPVGDREQRMSAAAELFFDRATEAGVALTAGAEGPDVERVCARLGGVPLAIELAAVRLRSMTLSELRRGLDGQL
jgi:predicted ATPase